ncbi:MAG TPA: metalloregulator ArsR/SmtB family transcription factor [Bacilli bacterium]|nr:metalloregulator ArsR/SmtB family transcription factor [Bacilli bacterium]
METDNLTAVFKALSHPDRRQILDLLRRGPMTVNEITEQFAVSRFQVMKHLGLLEEAQLVLVRRKGRERFNYLNAVPLRQMYDRWVSQYESGLAGSLLAFKEQMEKGSQEMELTKKNSFEIEMEVTIQAPREKVFAALTQDINQWWAYRLGGERTSTLHLEPKMGGRFYEDWGNGEGAVWGTVYYFQAPAEIRLNGPLGMKGAVNSDYSYVLEEQDGATVLKLSHQAVGLLQPDWEEAHRHGWQELLGQFLKEFVEEGKTPGA